MRSDNKNGFKISTDFKYVTDLLSDEEAGRLFKAILGYANDVSNVPDFDDLATQMAFNVFKGQFDKDMEAKEIRRKINIENGKKGGRPAAANKKNAESIKSDETDNNQMKPKKPIRLSCEKAVKKETDSGYSEGFRNLWEIYPRKESKAAGYRNYQRRLKDGYSPEQIYQAVDKYIAACKKENKPKQYIYKLRTFLDVEGEFTEYIPKKDEEQKKGEGSGYREINFRDFM